MSAQKFVSILQSAHRALQFNQIEHFLKVCAEYRKPPKIFDAGDIFKLVSDVSPMHKLSQVSIQMPALTLGFFFSRFGGHPGDPLTKLVIGDFTIIDLLLCHLSEHSLIIHKLDLIAGALLAPLINCFLHLSIESIKHYTVNAIIKFHNVFWYVLPLDRTYQLQLFFTLGTLGDKVSNSFVITIHTIESKSHIACVVTDCFQ